MTRVRSILCALALVGLLLTCHGELQAVLAKFGVDPWPGWIFYHLA